jgi:hypothetical protein
LAGSCFQPCGTVQLNGAPVAAAGARRLPTPAPSPAVDLGRTIADDGLVTVTPITSIDSSTKTKRKRGCTALLLRAEHLFFTNGDMWRSVAVRE